MFMESGGAGAGASGGGGGGGSSVSGGGYPGGGLGPRSVPTPVNVEKRPNPGDPDYVRPADPIKRQRLVDDVRQQGYGGMSTARGWRGTTGAMPFRDFAQESRQASHAFANRNMSHNPATADKQKKLANMFSPPNKIMFMGDFQAARQAAKLQKKCLLVNVQSDGEFDCHRLNRDVWKDETVENIIECKCIFWQQPSISEEAKTYCRRYNVAGFPHIALIDPRTGLKVWSFQGFLEPPEFIEKVTDIVDKMGLEEGAPARLPPPPPPPPQLPPSAGGSEDQMVAAAIAASLDPSNNFNTGTTASSTSNGLDGDLGTGPPVTARASAASRETAAAGGGDSNEEDNGDDDDDAHDEVTVVGTSAGTGTAAITESSSLSFPEAQPTPRREGGSGGLALGMGMGTGGVSGGGVVRVKGEGKGKGKARDAPSGTTSVAATNSVARGGGEVVDVTGDDASLGVGSGEEEVKVVERSGNVLEAASCAEEDEEEGEALEEEPDADNAEITRVRFRFPTGQNELRSFRKSSEVRQLFLFVRSRLEEAESRPFDVRTVRPPKSVRDHERSSIEEAGLSNSTVVVAWED
ncbi:unnamed protein product [Ascophyllum nodosum]